MHVFLCVVREGRGLVLRSWRPVRVRGWCENVAFPPLWPWSSIPVHSFGKNGFPMAGTSLRLGYEASSSLRTSVLPVFWWGLSWSIQAPAGLSFPALPSNALFPSPQKQTPLFIFSSRSDNVIVSFPITGCALLKGKGRSESRSYPARGAGGRCLREEPFPLPGVLGQENPLFAALSPVPSSLQRAGMSSA